MPRRAYWPTPHDPTRPFHRPRLARLLPIGFQQVARAYPDAQRIYVILDNWPVHFHATLRRELAATTPMRLLRLPTYAPWTNPVEKVWLRLSREVFYLHHGAQDWPALQAQVQAWLDQWTTPSPQLLHSVGLPCPP